MEETEKRVCESRPKWSRSKKLLSSNRQLDAYCLPQLGPDQDRRNLRCLLYPCQHVHLSLRGILPALPSSLSFSSSLPLTSPLSSILKHVDDILLPRSSSFTCLASGSRPDYLSYVFHLVVLGSCLTMIPIPKVSHTTPPAYSSRSTPSGRVLVKSPHNCKAFVITEVRSLIPRLISWIPR